VKTYCIAHITDLLKVPPEHWDECMRDIRGAMISLHLLEAAAAIAGEKLNPTDHCPCIEFTPDGKGEVTPTINGDPLFTMTLKRDDHVDYSVPSEKDDAPSQSPTPATDGNTADAYGANTP
jgi:hypothetical protein